MNIVQTVNQVEKKKRKDCGCSGKPELSELISCDTNIFNNNAKLYWRFNCESSWLTFETPQGDKKIIDSFEREFIEMTGRIGYVFSKEYKDSLLFQNRQISGCCDPIHHELLDKDTGDVIKKFGAIMHSSDLPDNNFVLSLSPDHRSLIFFDISSQTEHKILIPDKRIKRTVEKANTMFPEFLFKQPKIEDSNLELTYKYFDKNAPDNWGKDTIKIDLNEVQ